MLPRSSDIETSYLEKIWSHSFCTSNIWIKNWNRIINLISVLPNLHKNIKGLLGNIEDNIKMYYQLKSFFVKYNSNALRSEFTRDQETA